MKSLWRIVRMRHHASEVQNNTDSTVSKQACTVLLKLVYIQKYIEQKNTSDFKTSTENNRIIQQFINSAFASVQRHAKSTISWSIETVVVVDAYQGTRHIVILIWSFIGWLLFWCPFFWWRCFAFDLAQFKAW